MTPSDRLDLQPAAPVAPPEVGKLRVSKLPRVEAREFATGLRVLAIRRPTVPLVEMRLRIPVSRGARAGDGAIERVVGEAMLAGTAERSAVDVASQLQGLGASLGISVGLEHLQMGGSVLASNLRPFMHLVGDVLAAAAYPTPEVEVHRARVAQELAIGRSQPGTVAHEAVLGRLFGDHPYGRPMPSPDAAAAVTAAAARRFHRDRVAPTDAALIAVGDIRPAALFRLVEEALAGWRPGRSRPRPVPAPTPSPPGPIRVVHRPGSVQTSIRLAGPATTRHDPDHAAFLVASTAFGGGFSSRLNDNLREDKGYTYGAGCGSDHRMRASYVVIQADVATEVTARALTEIQYELARLVTAPLSEDEVRSAQRFRNGQLALSVQSQIGFASYLASIVPHGLTVDYLRRLPDAVDRVTPQTASEAARRYLAPSRLITVLVGDADAIVPQVEPLADVEVVSG